MMQFDKKDTNQMLIQVVDDEFDILNVIKLYLQKVGQKVGLNVFGFTDPNLALEHFRNNCKDYILVVSDVRMPGMNGFDFEVNSTELSIGLGGAKIEGFIQKPISLRKLSSMVQKQLEIKILSS
ncbi:MAG: putative signal transduction response regulator, receiver domain protein [Nitrososphaeraceae archaeon]|nr:putative signal transduction response regulator, receiver domain protein [Nitrososphaeraceae archaeon]